MAFIRLVEAVTVDEFTHQAFISEIDSALQTHFIGIGLVIHQPGGEAVEQPGGAS